MASRSLAYLLLTASIPLLLMGCKNKEAMLVGSWGGVSGTVLDLKADKSWSGTLPGGYPIEGTWSFDGKDAVVTPVSIQGKPVAEVKKKMEELASRLGSRSTVTARIAEDIDKPDYLTLSDDGKSLTTDKARKANGVETTLTKRD